MYFAFYARFSAANLAAQATLPSPGLRRKRLQCDHHHYHRYKPQDSEPYILASRFSLMPSRGSILILLFTFPASKEDEKKERGRRLVVVFTQLKSISLPPSQPRDRRVHCQVSPTFLINYLPSPFTLPLLRANLMDVGVVDRSIYFVDIPAGHHSSSYPFRRTPFD